MIDSFFSFSNFCTGQSRQVAILREVLPNQPIGVFVSSALPRSVRIGKECRCFQCFSDCHMVREFFAIVKRQCLNTLGHRTQAALNGALRFFGRLVDQLAHSQESRFAFNQSHGGTSMAFSDDRVAFPVTDSITRSHAGRPFLDSNPVRNPAVTLPAATVALAPLVPTAQMHPQVTTGGLVSEHELINPFRRNRNAVFESHSTANLLRAPVTSQQDSDFSPVLLGNPRARAAFTRTQARPRICLARSITPLTAVPAQFARNRARRSIKHLRHLADRSLCFLHG